MTHTHIQPNLVTKVGTTDVGNRNSPNSGLLSYTLTQLRGAPIDCGTKQPL